MTTNFVNFYCKTSPVALYFNLKSIKLIGVLYFINYKRYKNIGNNNVVVGTMLLT